MEELMPALHSLSYLNPFLSGNLLKGNRQTVKAQIRCHMMWHLIRVYIVC